MRVFLVAFFCLNQCIVAQSTAKPSAQTLVFTNVNAVDTRDRKILPDIPWLWAPAATVIPESSHNGQPPTATACPAMAYLTK